MQLVPTRDNYRLVGAAKTTESLSGAPSGPIIEELVAAQLTPLARGRYRVGADDIHSRSKHDVQRTQHEQRRQEAADDDA